MSLHEVCTVTAMLSAGGVFFVAIAAGDRYGMIASALVFVLAWATA